MMPFVSRDALGSALPIAAMQTDVCTCRNKCANDREITPLSCDGERGVKNIVVAMYIRVRLGAKQRLDSLGVPTPDGIHERGKTLGRLKLQRRLMFDESLNHLGVTLHRRVHQVADAVRILSVDIARHGKNASGRLGVTIEGGSH